MSTEIPFCYTNYEGLYEGFLIRIDIWMQNNMFQLHSWGYR